jgi:hypothetical protein
MQRPTRVDIPAAWTGQVLATRQDQWVRTFSAEEILELENAAQSYLDGKGDPGELTASIFPLPILGPKLADLRETLKAGVGFCLWRGLPVENWSIELAATAFCGIGAHLGSARSQNAKGHILGHVKDVGADLSNPNVRIYQTTERQSFHTDSTDAVGLLCLKEAMDGGDSLLVSTVTLYNEMQKLAPELAEIMFEPLATDRRGEVPEGQMPWFEVPVLNWYEGHLTGLYQRTYISSASRFDEAPQLSEKQTAALDLFDELANDPDIHLRMRLHPGDMQFVYNHSLLHDRTAFRDWQDRDDRRHLLRLWLALPDDRSLPPVFAQRYGSLEIGDRGGIITRNTKLNVPLAP